MNETIMAKFMRLHFNTVARNPLQWQYWQRMCDARVVDACEKKLEQSADKWEEAQSELMRVRRLLKLALVGANHQTMKLRDWQRIGEDADENNKRWEELLENREIYFRLRKHLINLR